MPGHKGTHVPREKLVKVIFHTVGERDGKGLCEGPGIWSAVTGGALVEEDAQAEGRESPHTNYPPYCVTVSNFPNIWRLGILNSCKGVSENK